MTKIEHLLSTLAEECAEVGQRASKALRFGLHEVQPGQSDNNVRRIEIELADVMATAELLGLVIREDEKAAKKIKLAKYLDYSRDLGTLED